MRLQLLQMLYSPERNRLAGNAPTGSVLLAFLIEAGVISGRRHTLHGVKDANGSSMGRGYKSITTLSAHFLRTFPLLCVLGLLAAVSCPLVDLLRARAGEIPRMRRRLRSDLLPPVSTSWAAEPDFRPDAQLGRASCRERV